MGGVIGQSYHVGYALVQWSHWTGLLRLMLEWLSAKLLK